MWSLIVQRAYWKMEQTRPSTATRLDRLWERKQHWKENSILRTCTLLTVILPGGCLWTVISRTNKIMVSNVSNQNYSEFSWRWDFWANIVCANQQSWTPNISCAGESTSLLTEKQVLIPNPGKTERRNCIEGDSSYVTRHCEVLYHHVVMYLAEEEYLLRAESKSTTRGKTWKILLGAHEITFQVNSLLISFLFARIRQGCGLQIDWVVFYFVLKWFVCVGVYGFGCSGSIFIT